MDLIAFEEFKQEIHNYQIANQAGMHIKKTDCGCGKYNMQSVLKNDYKTENL